MVNYLGYHKKMSLHPIMPSNHLLCTTEAQKTETQNLPNFVIKKSVTFARENSRYT